MRSIQKGSIVAALALGVLATACASAPVRRGGTADDIHAAVVEAAATEGYKCVDAPDRSVRTCTHPDLTDVSFAYLPASNLLQVWTVFRRDDDALVPEWRSGSCDPLAASIAKLNDGTVLKLVCAEDSYRFELESWVPENGMTEADLVSLFRLFRAVVAENITSGGFLAPKDGAAAPAAAAAATPTDT